MLISNQLIGFGAQVAVPQAHVLFADSAGTGGLGGSSATQTFSSRNFGTAYANRYLLVGVATSSTGATDFSSITIGGVSATKIIDAAGGTWRGALWIASVPTGTSGSVVFTPAAGLYRIAWVLWNVRDIASATAYATATDTTLSPLSVSLNIPAGGILAAFEFCQSQTSCTWSGPTEDADGVTTSESYGYSGASGEYATAQSSYGVTVTPTGTGSQQVLVAASFSPA